MAARLALGITDAGKAFTLPADLVSQSTAILAKRRVGKSYLASVIAEELLAFEDGKLSLTPEGRRLARGEGPPPTTFELHRRVLATLTGAEAWKKEPEYCRFCEEPVLERNP